MDLTRENIDNAAATAIWIMPLYLATLQQNGSSSPQEKRLFLTMTANVLGQAIIQEFPEISSELIMIIGKANNGGDFQPLSRQLETLRLKYSNDPAKQKICDITYAFINAVNDNSNIHRLLEVLSYEIADAIYLAKNESIPWGRREDWVRKVVRKEIRKLRSGWLSDDPG